MRQKIILLFLCISFINFSFFNQFSQKSAVNDSIIKSYSALINNIYSISEYYYYEGRLNDAIKLLSSAQMIVEMQEVNEVDKTLIYNQLGKIYAFNCFTNNSGYEEALKYLFKAKSLAEDINNQTELANAMTFLGFTYYAEKFNNDEGDYDTPLKYFLSGLEIRKNLNDTRGIAESNIYIGIIHERKEEVDKALSNYNTALNISDLNNHRLEKSYATRHIAFIRQANGDIDGALDYFLESLKLREEVGYKIYLHFSNLTVGGVYEVKKQFYDAIKYYKKAYFISKVLNAKRVIVLSAISLGDAYKATKNLVEARNYLTEAMDISKKINYQKGVNLAAEKLKELEAE